MTLLWVAGASGLLGSAVCREAQRLGWAVVAPRLSWDDPAASVDVIDRAASQFGDAPVQVAWCAGSGTTASPAHQFVAEQQMFELLAQRLRQSGRAASARLFLASSLGALHAGAGRGPFAESSPVQPLSHYGNAKVAMEQLASRFAVETGACLVIGRLANLYGPGQDLGKAQGLVSALLVGAIRRTPVQIYVPLDTLRDYLFVDDAARVVVECLTRVDTVPSGTVVTKVLATGQRTSVAAVIEQVRRIGHRRLLVVQGASPLASVQSRDLSARSQVWTDLDSGRTMLAEGLWRTWNDLNARYLRAEL